MLSKCANPECSAPFHYLHDGRLFEIELAEAPPDLNSRKKPVKTERFWLCASCAAVMTLAITPDKQVRLLPLKPALRAVAS